MPHSAKPKAKAARKIDFDAAQYPVRDERAADFQQCEHLPAGNAEPDGKLKDDVGNECGGDKAHAGVKPSGARADSRATPVPRMEANQNTCHTQHVVGKGKASPREIANTPKASPRAPKQQEAAGRKAQGAEAHGWSAWRESEARSPGSRHKAGGLARTDQVNDGQEGQGTNRRLYADMLSRCTCVQPRHARCHNATKQGFGLLVYGNQVCKLSVQPQAGIISLHCAASIKSRAMSHRICTQRLHLACAGGQACFSKDGSRA